MEYLFFDVECANCFGGVGKMCSFGYVLADESFNIIESDDIVMNPECEFDWYLYKNKNDIKLAYSQEFFRSNPNFPNHYERIKSLLTRPGVKVFGFSSLNDVGFVVTACERYNLPVFDFAAYDLERIVKSDDEIFGSLEERCRILGVDSSDLQAHKSSDDAVMTMRLLKAFCGKKSLSVESVMKSAQNVLYSTKTFIRKREERKEKKMRQARYAESWKNSRGGGAGGRKNPPKSGASLEKRRRDSRTITFD
ncbi:MAG: hypothetical protein IJ717_01815 [Treponema sp.]|nr:hypothetical protein [Treponema sp.]